jgi:20S proteasome subunit alpha 3
MARRYDSRTTIFSPEGRLYQVEYAMEAIMHAGTTIGILSSEEGIVLAAERKMASNLFEADQISLKKIYPIHKSSLLAAVAGITSDANMLVKYARQVMLKHAATFGASDQPSLYMPVEQLVQRVCNLKQGYTQMGGLRPFGASIIYAGYDEYFGFQLYQSDPSGNYAGWKATAMGANTSAAQSVLKNDYPDISNQEMEPKSFTLYQAQLLAIKVLKKTMEASRLKGELVEMSIIQKDPQNPQQVIIKNLTHQEVDSLISAFEDQEKALGDKDDENESSTERDQSKNINNEPLYFTTVS